MFCVHIPSLSSKHSHLCPSVLERAFIRMKATQREQSLETFSFVQVPTSGSHISPGLSVLIPRKLGGVNLCRYIMHYIMSKDE